MGQRTHNFLRFFSKRDRRSDASLSTPTRPRSIDTFPNAIPFHAVPTPSTTLTPQLHPLHPDIPIPSTAPPTSRRPPPRNSRDKNSDPYSEPERCRTSKRIAFARSNSISSYSASLLTPSSTTDRPAAADPYLVRNIPSISSDIPEDPSSSAPLDNFVPYRPAPPSRTPFVADFRVSTTTPDVSSLDSELIDAVQSAAAAANAPNTAYSRKVSSPRFVLRRRHRRSQPPKESAPERGLAEDSNYFGATQHDDRERGSEVRPGEEVLIRFIRNTLGPKAQNLAVRLMNKTPITSSTSFAYVIHQETEDSDIDIIRRDLTAGRLYSSGVRLLGGAWCNLLLGDRFAPGASPRQRHELTYRRSSCSCITCRVRNEMARVEAIENHGSHSEFESDMDTTSASADILSSMSSTGRTPSHSAMANFVVKYKLPSNESLMTLGASSSSRELEIGTVVRLNYRASAKLKFTEDVRELFGHLAYTGPISHEEVYRRVTTIGVHYYLYNKGKKERKVYIQGDLIRLPVQVGVIKLGTQPMYLPELGATFCLYRKQIMSIYVGEIVLEGNSIGSFIKTGIRYYIGFGEERGVCPVYPNKSLGKARKLGINELLLHHHMVEDLEVKCV